MRSLGQNHVGQCDRPALGQEPDGQDPDGRVPVPEQAAQHAQGLAQGNTQRGQQV